MKALFFIAALLITLAAARAADVGSGSHGGRVWECPSDSGTTYRVFDYDYGNQMWGLTNNLPEPSPTDTEISIAQAAVDRLQSVEHGRAIRYKMLLDDFNGKRKFTDYYEYLNTNDLGLTIGVKKGCRLVQIIFQQEQPQSPYRFFISEEIWNHLDLRAKAGLILHEIIYEDSIMQGNEKADPVVLLNAILASDRMQTYTREEWITVLRDTNQGYFSPDGSILLKPRGLKLDKSGQVISGDIKQISSAGINTFKSSYYEIKVDGWYDRKETGAIELGDPNGIIGIEGKPHRIWPGDGYSRADQVMLLPDGGMYVDFQRSISLDLPTPSDKPAAASIVLLNNKGGLVAARLDEEAKITTSTGKPKTYQSGEWVFFINGKAFDKKGGIYSIGDNEHFIKIENQKRKMIGFRKCLFAKPDECEQIGKEAFYPKKWLLAKMRTSQKEGKQIDNAGPVMLAVFGLTGAGVAVPYLIVTASAGPIGWFLGGAVIGVMAGVYGGSTIGDRWAEDMNKKANTDIAQQARATKHMLRDRFWLITNKGISIDALAFEIAKSID